MNKNSKLVSVILSIVALVLFVVSFVFLYYVKSLDFNNVVIPVFKDIIFF